MYQFQGTAKVFNGRFWSAPITVRAKASGFTAAVSRCTVQAIKHYRDGNARRRIEQVTVTIERLGPVITVSPANSVDTKEASE